MNSQAFTPEDVEKGLHFKLINTLLDLNKELKNYYNEILITSDSYCTIVQWVERHYDWDDCRFEYISDDEYVMRKVEFPDNSYELIYSDEDPQEYLDDWLKKNPGWTKTQYGQWINEQKEQEEIECVKNQYAQMSLSDFGIEVE